MGQEDEVLAHSLPTTQLRYGLRSILCCLGRRACCRPFWSESGKRASFSWRQRHAWV